MQTITSATEECLCNIKQSSHCDRCKLAECEVEGHIQIKHWTQFIICDKCTNEGWKYDDSIGVAGRWINTRPENETWIEEERKLALQNICEWYKERSTKDFTEFMSGMIQFCTKMGFY